MSRSLRRDPDHEHAGRVTGAGHDDVTGQSRRPLFRGMGVAVDDFQCRAHVEPPGQEEPNPTHSIVFVRRGVFVRSERREALVADATQILFFNQGAPYRYAHPLPGGDDCTILMLDDERAWTATGRLDRRGRTGSSGPFPIGRALCTVRAARLHHELLTIVPGDSGTSDLDVQEIVAELVDHAIAALHQAVGTGRSPGSGDGTRRRRELVEAARLVLSRSVDAPPSLVELAEALNCSPFHLSRTFRATTGIGLRHYVRRLRLLLAADRLRQGERDLTSVALDLGFYDHSHFTNAFRRELGVPPSRWRGRTQGAESRRARALTDRSRRRKRA